MRIPRAGHRGRTGGNPCAVSGVEGALEAAHYPVPGPAWLVSTSHEFRLRWRGAFWQTDMLGRFDCGNMMVASVLGGLVAWPRDGVPARELRRGTE
jgi:hypothetical protein